MINWIRRHFKVIWYLLGLAVLCILFIVFVNVHVNAFSRRYICSEMDSVPGYYTGIVLGAHVYQSGVPSNYLQDRLDKAIELYKSGKVKRLLLSGDHGRTNYDEVNTMKQYLLEQGVDTSDIFLDHAGFDTYNTMYRAKEIFEVKEAIIVTQDFHLPRAVYIARKLGLNAYGICADKQKYSSLNYLQKREKFANIKAFLELWIHKKPRFLGEKIPITGDNSKSFD